MIKTRTLPGAKPQIKKKRGFVHRFPDQQAVLCADGELRPSQKFGAERTIYLIPPGTPITRCAQCDARVCRLNRSQMHGQVMILDYASGEGSEINEFYAPHHIC